MQHQSPHPQYRARRGFLVGCCPLTALAQKKIVLGFSQVGAESEWRTANTESIKASAKEAGIELKFSDAQQKQENQIKAIRSFIAQKVDVIAFSPVVESGWETVLREAKAAKIPVVLTDRSVNTKDDTLYVTFMGSDFVEEGRKAGRWLVEKMKDQKGEVNIVELQGTVGSAPAIDRKKGFEEIIKADPKFKIIRSQTGDFTRAKGKEVMEAFLKAEGKKINVLYAHNDDMAIGAIQAIEEAGMKPAKDITIISIDAVKGAFEAMIAGKLNVSVECSPLLGPAADERGERHQGRQAAAQAHRDRRRHLPDGSGGEGIPQPQVLRATTHETHISSKPLSKRTFLKICWPVSRHRRHRAARACAGQGPDRHLDADQVVGPLDRRRRQHGQVLKEKRLQDRPAVRRRRHSEPARADREHGHQGLEGSGDRGHRRHHAVRRAAEGGRQGRQGHRLRPPDQGLEERRLLRHLRQLPGRRAAGTPSSRRRSA
jgi:ABC-type sugar transport system substrate-binding protein